MKEFVITMKDGSYLGICSDYFEFASHAMIFRTNDKITAYIPNGYYDYIQEMIDEDRGLGQKIYRTGVKNK